LTVSVPIPAALRASFLGTNQNELLYRVDGPNHALLQDGTIGSFSSPVSSGTKNFSLEVPAADNMVLSLQLNDAATHSVLAVGAVVLNLVTAPPDQLIVDLGSVTRTCYTLNVPGGFFPGPESYNFVADNLVTVGGPGYDFRFNYSAGSSVPLTISDAQGTLAPANTVAYLGNGELVDFDYVPSISSFQSDSSLAKGAPVSINDVFCLSLGTIPGGHAWFQVTNLGNGTLYQGPQFRYRVNDLVPYFAYERTATDVASACSTLW
jgi:hypothetical protein